jgi:proteasome lid subunit RPN8/RPN11
MIRVTEKDLTAIRKHAMEDHPFECCGLLLGRFGQSGEKTVVETYAISNARDEKAKRTRFLIEPEELMRGERYAAGKKLDVVGFYHSHPDCPAVPSTYDLEHAWPTYSYIIVSVTKESANDLFSWEQCPDRSQFNSEEIVIECQ